MADLNVSVSESAVASDSSNVQIPSFRGTFVRPIPFGARFGTSSFRVQRSSRQPPLFLGLVVSQARQRAYIGRTPPPPHLKPGYPGTPPLPVGLFVSQAVQRALIGQRAPAPHLAPGLTSPLQTGLSVSQARQRPYVGRTVPAPHLPPAVTGPRPFPPGLNLSQAEQRPYLGRTVPAPHLARPIVGPQPLPPSLVVTTALRRPYVGRTVPAPHLAPAVLQAQPYRSPIVLAAVARSLVQRGASSLTVRRSGPVKPVPVGTFVRQAVQRALIGRTPPPPHLAVLRGAAVVPSGTFVSQAVRRALVRRDAAPPHLARSIVGAPVEVGLGVYISQAVARAPSRRTVPAPHLPPPVGPVPQLTYVVVSNTVHRAPDPSATLRQPLRPRVAPPVVPLKQVAPSPPAIVVSQAAERSYQGRGTSSYLVRRAPVAKPLFLGLVVSQAVERALVGRTVPLRPLLPPAVVSHARPVRYVGTFVSQAIQRPTTRRRVPPAPHVPPIVGVPIGPGATIKLQAQARALVDRRGRVRLPTRGRGLPVRPGTFVSQAIQRAYLGRGPNPAPHAAAPLVKPFVVTSGRFFYQAIQRSQERRYRDVGPVPHLAKANLAAPGPRATIVLQAQARALVDRRGRVRLPGTPPPARFQPALVVSQALQRPYVGRRAPTPHLAPPRTFKSRGATIVLQARQRPYVGRTVPKPHLARPTVPHAVIQSGTFVYAALERQLVRREGRVRLPVPGAAVQSGTFVYAALARNLVRREGRVRLPVRGGNRPVPRGTFVSQAIRRPFVGRQPLSALTVGPIVTPSRPPLVTVPRVLSQAIQRALVGRRVPVPPRYLPIIFVPHHPPGPPHRRITRRGGTSPVERGGVTSPRPSRFGTTNPEE